MFTLDATTASLEVVLAGAITTNQLPIVSCFADKTATAFTPGKTTTQTNSTSTVTIIAAPAASTQREVHSINIYNADTVAATITVRENDNGTLRILCKIALSVSDTLQYIHNFGWRVIDTNGNTKASSSTTTVNSPAGASGDVQYNAGSAFGAEAAFNYNATTNTLLLDNLTLGVAGTVPTPAESDNDTSIATTAFVNSNQSDAWGSINNTSKNNAGTPNTQFDLTADVVILRNTSNHIVVRYAPGTITNDVSTVGANGRDQAGAFSASSWIHFYWIWNVTTLATLSSTVTPTTGPTLPSGYTHWAYCCAVRFNGSSQLIKVRVRGKWVYLELRQLILNNGAATTETAVDLSGFVPPNALEFQLEAIQTQTTSAGGTYAVATELRVVSGSSFWTANVTMNGLGASSAQIATPVVFIMPNVAQNMFYINTNTTGSVVITLVYDGYSVPNGGS